MAASSFKPVQSLVIVFGDNDFIHTFQPLIETLHRALQGNPNFTPEQLIRLIGEGVRFHYLAFQNQYRYEDRLDSTEKYLKEGLRILFDADADLAFQTEDHDSSAWHLHIPSGQINAF